MKTLVGRTQERSDAVPATWLFWCICRSSVPLAPAYVALDRLSDIGNVVDWLARPDDQMDVLGHEHVCPQRESQIGACLIDRLRQSSTGAFCLQKTKTLVARKRQPVSVPRFVAVSAMATIRSHGRGHSRSTGGSLHSTPATPKRHRQDSDPTRRVPVGRTQERSDAVPATERPHSKCRRG